MASNRRDDNRVPNIAGVDSVTFLGNVEPAVDSTNHGLVSNIGNTFITKAYDYIGVDVSGSTTDVYTYKTGGSGGTTVGTLTLTYTDSTKATLSSVAKT